MFSDTGRRCIVFLHDFVTLALAVFFLFLFNVSPFGAQCPKLYVTHCADRDSFSAFACARVSAPVSGSAFLFLALCARSLTLLSRFGIFTSRTFFFSFL
jgi:hypothetical protein